MVDDRVPDARDIQIHVHEHVAPLRERVGRIEGRMEVHERELTLLRAGIDNLRDRIDAARTAMLDALEDHTTDEIKRFDAIKDSGIVVAGKVDALRNWVLAIGLGAGGVFALFELLVKMGLITHGGN